LKPGSRALPSLPSAPSSRAAVETPAGGSQPRAAGRPNPFLPANPFASEAAPQDPSARKLPWALIVCGGVSVIVLALLLAKFTN
jgi:hypothetical protein